MALVIMKSLLKQIAILGILILVTFYCPVEAIRLSREDSSLFQMLPRGSNSSSQSSGCTNSPSTGGGGGGGGGETCPIS